jgi:hypothetical protein
MSRHERTYRQHLVVFGWDRPLSTYFGQVFPPVAVVDEARAIEAGRGRPGRAAVQCDRCEAVAVITIPRADVEVPCRVCGLGRLGAGPGSTFHPDVLDTGVSIRWVGMMEQINSVDELAKRIGRPWDSVLDNELRRLLYTEAHA